MQGGGEGHEVQTGTGPEAPEIRPKLHHKVGQATGHRRPENPQGGD